MFNPVFEDLFSGVTRRRSPEDELRDATERLQQRDRLNAARLKVRTPDGQVYRFPALKVLRMLVRTIGAEDAKAALEVAIREGGK